MNKILKSLLVVCVVLALLAVFTVDLIAARGGPDLTYAGSPIMLNYGETVRVVCVNGFFEILPVPPNLAEDNRVTIRCVGFPR